MLMPLSLLPSRGRCRGGGSVTLLLPHPGDRQRAAWHGPCLLRPLTATGPSLPVQSPPTTPTSRRARTPWKHPSSRSPSRTRRWPWGRRCCSSASSRPTPSQKVSEPAAREHDGLWHCHPPACPCPLGPPELGGLGLAGLWLCSSGGCRAHLGSNPRWHHMPGWGVEGRVRAIPLHGAGLWGEREKAAGTAQPAERGNELSGSGSLLHPPLEGRRMPGTREAPALLSPGALGMWGKGVPRLGRDEGVSGGLSCPGTVRSDPACARSVLEEGRGAAAEQHGAAHQGGG